MSAMGPNALLMLALFLPAALHAPCLPRTGRVFSLSCVPWRQARVESCSKMLLPSKGEKRESHLVVPVGDFRAAFPPRSFSPAPFHGWLKAGQRTPLRWSEVRARLRRCEEGFSSPLQTPGDVTRASGALSVAAVKAQADGILIRCEGSQQLGQMGPPRRCGVPAASATQRQEKRGRVFANARRDGLSQRHEMTRARLQPGCPE